MWGTWAERSGWQALVTPIERIVDLERFGAALLITSECDGAAWQPGGPFEDGPKLLLPGGKYSVRSRRRYREQSMLAIDMMSKALMQAGISPDCIVHLDCQDGLAAYKDPVTEIHKFIRETLNPVTRCRDCLIYYFGFAIESGQWALTWTNDQGYSKVCILDPNIILPPPGPDDGVPGARFVISDAPGTARMWMRPARRLRGVAAWQGEALPGSNGGPPMTRWLTGLMPEPPKGVLAFLEPAPEVGLEDLPCHKALFWGPSPPDPALSRHLLWELTEFLGAETMREHRSQGTEEILIKGGPQMLLFILETQIKVGQDDLALQLLWLLQALAAEAPTERWADTMNEALSPAMSIPDWLGHGYGKVAENAPQILAAVLSFLASCASQCARCREECSEYIRWPKIQQLIFAAFQSCRDHLAAPDAARFEPAARAACRMTAQIAAHHPLDVEEHEELVCELLGMLSQSSELEELREAAAEALLYVTFRCNKSKGQVLELIGQYHPNCISDALTNSRSARTIERILTFLRSVAACQPPTAVLEAFPSGCHEGGILDVVIEMLERYDTDPGVQRWGLAALGTICSADEALAHRAVDAGATKSVIWALGAEVLSQAKFLEQDALFCAYALLSTEQGQEQLAPTSGIGGGGVDGHMLPGLAASAVARALREDSCEAAMWGMRIFERICQRHALIVEPYVDVILDAMLAENCLHGTMVAASNAVSHLASVCPVAREKLLARYVSLIKALQCKGHIAACEGTEDGKERERELMDWVQVLVDILGPPRPVKSDDQILREQLRQLEADEVKSAEKSGSKSNTGTKSNPGTKSRTGTMLDSASRSGTKTNGTKEGAGRESSKLASAKVTVL